MRVGIIGQSGFIGGYLYSSLRLSDQFERVEFLRRYWNDLSELANFVDSCDLIFHLAGVSRSDNGEELFNTNMLLVEKLIAAMEKVRFSGTIVFGSTTHQKDTPYHQSKALSHQRLLEWSKARNLRHVTALMPNTFGPFARPFWNSVVSTFAYQVANLQTPTIMQDGDLKLISVKTLTNELIKIGTGSQHGAVEIPHEFECKVSELLATLQKINQLPVAIETPFEVALMECLNSYY